MWCDQRHPTAFVAALVLVKEHGADALNIASSEIEACLHVGDTDAALAMDQVRREVAMLLHR